MRVTNRAALHPFLKLFFSFVALTASSHAARIEIINDCQKDLSERRIARVEKLYRREMAELPDSLRALRIESATMTPVRLLGRGSGADVIEVRLGQRNAALKIVYGAMLSKESTEAVVIQRALGRLGLAPKVLGIVDVDDFEDWKLNFNSFFQKLPRMTVKAKFVFVMELTNPKSFKAVLLKKFEKFSVSLAESIELHRQMRTLESVFARFDIVPEDPDATIVGNKVLLIDIGRYKFGAPVDSRNFFEEFNDYFDRAVTIEAP